MKPPPPATPPPDDRQDQDLRATSYRRVFIPWAAAACLVLIAIWLMQLYFARQSRARLIDDQLAMIELALESSRQQLEAERILAYRHAENLGEQIASLRAQIGEHEGRAVPPAEQIDALSRSGAERSDPPAGADSRGAAPPAESAARSGTTNLKISILASVLEQAPDALAVAVWDADSQEGMLRVEHLPASGAEEDYQLWIADPRYPNPVDGGVFTVDPDTGGAMLRFTASRPVNEIQGFVVTRERKGGAPTAGGPLVLSGQ